MGRGTNRPFSVSSILRSFRLRTACEGRDEKDSQKCLDEDAPETFDNNSYYVSGCSKRQRKALDHIKRYEEWKLKVPFPEHLAMEDVNADDVILLNVVKGIPGAVPVPQHWKSGCQHSDNKSSVPRMPHAFEECITNSPLVKGRIVHREGSADKSLKDLLKRKLHPKLEGAHIDYEKYKNPEMYVCNPLRFLNRCVDVYGNGQKDATSKGMLPGVMSDELMRALGITGNMPPPWLFRMQLYGLPPEYSNVTIPGVNGKIPMGCRWGFEEGCWGRPHKDVRGQFGYLGTLVQDVANPCEENEQGHFKPFHADHIMIEECIEKKRHKMLFDKATGSLR